MAPNTLHAAAASPTRIAIPVAKPLLPHAKQLTPYLEKIDGERSYSNFGPLVECLEKSFAEHFGQPPGTVSTAANGTAALTTALLASGAPEGTFCIVPAWTFVATAHAIVSAGLQPYFSDVSEHDGALTPELVRHALNAVPGKIGAVVPVVPFGAPIDYAAWETFASETGLPVVLDAAAAFDTVPPGNVPAIVSLHATKILGIGEGGLVLCRDTNLITDVRRRTNFGFMGTREASVRAFNGKMSEYQAAVGLAALDTWNDIRAGFMNVASAYAEHLSPLRCVALQSGYGRDWVASTCVVRFGDPIAERVASELAAQGIDTRMWWGRGVHRHPVFTPCPRTPLPITEKLAASTLGLPCYRDMSRENVARVCMAIQAVLDKKGTRTQTFRSSRSNPESP